MPVTLPTKKEETQGVLTPLYNVVLLDDDFHTVDYVMEMLQSLFLISRENSYIHAMEVHHMGRTIVLTAELGMASYARDQIHGYGADYRIPESKGSMTAVLEPASMDSPGRGGGVSA